MNFRSMIPVIVFSSSMAFADTEISDFRWKKRLLVVSEASEALVKQFVTEKTWLLERNLQVFILSGYGKSEYPVKPKLAVEFTERLSTDPKTPKVYLIGKDGRTTLEWSLQDFTFKKLYASIDAMPMRQSEMKERK